MANNLLWHILACFIEKLNMLGLKLMLVKGGPGGNIMGRWIPMVPTCVSCGECNDRADSRFAPSQWETSLQSNAVSHWLGANLESALLMRRQEIDVLFNRSLMYDSSITMNIWK